VPAESRFQTSNQLAYVSVGARGSLPGDSCGVRIGASMSSSPNQNQNENRKNGNSASSVLLAAAGCCPAAAGSIAARKAKTEVVAEEPQGEPSIHRTAGQAPRGEDTEIKAKDFELGGYFGALSIQDFGTIRSTACARPTTCRRTFSWRPFLARSKAGPPPVSRMCSRRFTVVSDSGRRLTYYDLDVGYNVLPGESFLGRGTCVQFQPCMLTVGMGDVKFADKDRLR